MNHFQVTQVARKNRHIQLFVIQANRFSILNIYCNAVGDTAPLAAQA
jgi:hypothetical protein